MESGKGILFLPSLKHKRLIEINNLDLDEATEFVDHVSSTLVFSARHVIDWEILLPADLLSYKTPNIIYYKEVVDAFNIACPSLHAYVMEHIKQLTRIMVGGKKFVRAVFIDMVDGTVGVGTTLISSDHCNINFTDNSIKESLEKIQNYIDKYEYRDII